MNLENQTVTGNNQVTVSDSLNASLMELTIKPTATSVAPNTNELFIYVDKQPQSNPSNERKQYLFDLEDILRIYNSTADEFKQRLEVVNNDIILRSFVERKVSYDETLQQCSILADSEFEELESFPITLFEGVNYIYTNYSNADISLIYTKDTLYNKAFLNGSMYYNHKLRNDGEFCLDDIYFKDAFTKTGDDLNLEVNNASVDSLSSNNNTFSLDENGNLVVNSISCNSINSNTGGGNLDPSAVCNLIYPVGSIYLSVNTTSPATLFGGTWERIKDKFLLGVGDTYSLNDTGGEAQHTLVQSEIPAHTHDVTGDTGGGGSHSHNIGADLDAKYVTSGTRSLSLHGNGVSGAGRTIASSSVSNHTHNISLISSSVGGGTAHNNMPPYITVNIWKRTA